MVQEPADNRGDRMDFKVFTTTTKLPLSSGEKIWREEGGLCRVFISLIGASKGGDRRAGLGLGSAQEEILDEA